MNTRLISLITILLGLLLVVEKTMANTQPNQVIKEYQLKAAYLYNFATLIKWPSSVTDQYFNICYSGAAETEAGLENLDKKEVNGSPIKLIHMLSVGDFEQCRMIFLAKSSRLKPEYVLQAIHDLPILTVSDDIYSANNSGLIILIRPEGKRLVFEINNDEAQRRQLEISSRLLRLSR